MATRDSWEGSSRYRERGDPGRDGFRRTGAVQTETGHGHQGTGQRTDAGSDWKRKRGHGSQVQPTGGPFALRDETTECPLHRVDSQCDGGRRTRTCDVDVIGGVYLGLGADELHPAVWSHRDEPTPG